MILIMSTLPPNSFSSCFSPPPTEDPPQHIHIYLLSKRGKQFWTQKILNCANLFMQALHLFIHLDTTGIVFGTFHALVWSFINLLRDTCSWQAATLNNVVNSFLSPQQFTETLDCGPLTPYILYPRFPVLAINSSIFQACIYHKVKSEEEKKTPNRLPNYLTKGHA